jgi:hypothetical protein
MKFQKGGHGKKSINGHFSILTEGDFRYRSCKWTYKKTYKKKNVLEKKFLFDILRIKRNLASRRRVMSRVFTLCSAAAVLAATGAFAQMSRGSQSAPNPCACMEQGLGLPMEKKCFPAAYNAPASIAVSCGWDFNVSARFIYWYTSQEGLDVAHVKPGGLLDLPTNGAVLYSDFDYQPGFKVAVGYNTNYDDWVGWAEYTWLHTSEATASTGVWDNSDWFAAGRVAGEPVDSVASVSANWKMHLDMLDVFFSRPYYQGTQLTVSPYAGIRALWIRQAFSVNDVSSALTSFAVNPRAKTKSNSWGIGPAAGAMGHWLLGMGFRFEGNATGSLRYTQYSSIAWKQSYDDSSGATAKTNNYGTVRPMAQLGVGLGYGSYLYCQKYYIDFSARYDFNYLWNQNVMRPFVSELVGRENDCGDLSMHGLTLNARFDF